MADSLTVREENGPPPQEFPPRVLIPEFQVAISRCTQSELLDSVAHAVRRRRKCLVDHVNIDNLWHAQRDATYRQILNHRSEIAVADGVPVCWLSRLAGLPLPQRLALTDVVPALFHLATQHAYSVFILGSNPRTLAQAQDKLMQDNSLPRAVNSWSQPRETLEQPGTRADVLRRINEAAPDLLLVALGAPWQSLWIARHWEELPSCVIVPVGGAFDFLAGRVGRAPEWMQRCGLEWLYRLLFDHQPRQRSLFERYILTDLPFAVRLAWSVQMRRYRERSAQPFPEGPA